MKSADLLASDLTYTSATVAVREVLLASPHAILHLKLQTIAGKTKLTTEVRAMSPHWWEDRFVKLKGHDFYRRMEGAGRRHKARINPVSPPFGSFQAAIDHYGLEPLMKADEKAMNAWMTLMGHNAEMVHENDFRQAREAAAEKKAQARREQEAVVAKEKATADAEWGMF